MCSKDTIGWLDAAITGNIGSCYDAYKFSCSYNFYGPLLGWAGIFEDGSECPFGSF
jgi:hypothetical protein